MFLELICTRESWWWKLGKPNFIGFAKKLWLPKLDIFTVCSDKCSHNLFFWMLDIRKWYDCEVEFKVVLVPNWIWMLVWHFVFYMEEWNVMVKRITRDPETWVCILSPPFTSQVTLNKLNTLDLTFFKSKTGSIWWLRRSVVRGTWENIPKALRSVRGREDWIPARYYY